MNELVSVPVLAAGARPKPIIPTDMEQVWRLATIIAKSGMAPKNMEKAETITVALLHGLEVGLPPLMALQRIAVINGRPAIWGDAAIGLVRASGLCEGITEDVTGDGDGMTATCRARRKGEKEATERMFSVDDAKRAGLWNKAGPWQQYPKRMLQMRARAFALRDLFADVLGGLYIAEELDGDELAQRPIKNATPRPLPPPLPPRRPLESASEPAGVVAEAESPKAQRPLPPAARPKEEPAFDGAQWLKNLERAASLCEDAASLFNVQETLYKANLMRVAPADCKKATEIMREHFTRIGNPDTMDDVPASRPRPVALEKRLAQQAGICCADPVFQKFAGVETEELAAVLVRMHCGVSSRSDIKEGTAAGRQWQRFYSDFLLWRDHPELKPA